MSISQRDIDQAHSDLHAKCGGHKNDYFALLYLEREFQLYRDIAITRVAFGNNDYGFDAFHFDSEKRNLYLYQFKWSDSHEQFKESLKRLVDAGFQRIFGARDQDRRQNDLLQQLHSCLRENYNIIDQVCLHFVFRGDPAKAEASQTLESLCEDLENKKHLIDNFFNHRPVVFVIEYRSSATAKVGGTSYQIRTRSYQLRIDQILSGLGPQGQQMRIAFVPLIDLMKMYREMGPRFFERNIRAGLQSDKFVNRELTRAFKAILEGTQPPSLFAFNHNGVTLAAEAVVEGDGEYEIIEPRLLNGAQTVTTLERFLTLKEGDEALKETSLKDVRVLCKIITNGDADFINRVTLNNNRQNAVAPWNLHANDRIQLELADKLRDDLQIFYERQENAFSGLSDDALEELSITEKKAIELVPLARTFLASDGHVDRLSNMTQVFEDEKQYVQVFNDARLRADSRHIVLCYKLQRRLGKAIHMIEEKGDRYAFVRRGRNLVWALLCQAVLNHKELSSYSERYGKSLTAEADYTQWITHLAVTKVGPSISELVTTNEGYKKKLAEEKLDFLRTNSAYSQCMDIAYNKWGWVKKRLMG